MYKIGRFTVIGEDEPAPAGSLPIRLLPLVHYAAYPWWSQTTADVLEAMGHLDLSGKAVLDFGCGASAILSIAVAALGGTPYPVEIHPDLAVLARQQLDANDVSAPVMTEPPAVPFDFAVVNVGDAVLVGIVSKLAPHGIGTAQDGALIQW